MMRTSTSVHWRKRINVDDHRTTAIIRGVLIFSLFAYTIVTVVVYVKISNQELHHHFLPWNTGDKLKARSPSDYDNPIERLQHTFPIMVGSDLEVISHPGLSLADPKKIPNGLSTTLVVPKFFDESFGHFYGNGTIREFLGNGDRLMTPEEANSIGSFNSDGLETIYCSIASYRDPECSATVEDIYARAEFPERLRVAIVEQRVDGDPICNEPAKSCDEAPDQALCKYKHLIDVSQMDARLGVGPVFARHLAHRHYRGEYFAMQVDSHVRFTANWDTDIIAQWKSAKNEMAVLSTYPSDIIGRIDPVTHKGTKSIRPIMCTSDYEGEGANRHIRHGQQYEHEPIIKGQPMLHPFWAAGFSFARGHFVIQVPYDQYLPMVFQGEEISIGVRGFTYGYDYYTLERGVCFHIYAIKENKERRKNIPKFWENSKVYEGVRAQAMKRLNTIVGVEHYSDSEWHHDDEKKYGLGNVRKPEKFYTTFGIHTDEHRMEGNLCKFVGKPMMDGFMPALRKNRMGLDYDKIDFVFKDPEPKDEKK